jgi:glycine hydroxymethyltransferase
MTFTTGARHDEALLTAAAQHLADETSEALAARVRDLVARNAAWRGARCVNLIAAESPTSPMVRALLAAEVGTRASGGHIGELSRCFPGMTYIDQLEALCVELLKELFHADFADQRLMGGMASCMVAFAALAQPGEHVMSLPLSAGGDSSGHADGPAGVRGLTISDIPFDPVELTVDLDRFRCQAEIRRPRVVSINQTTALFPLPVKQMRQIIEPWGGRLYFDGAHQAGLIAGGQYPNPLAEGADVLTGSGGKTFSGPQSGMILWNDERLGDRIVEAVFPMLTGSHQLNRVAALALACCELREYGTDYMAAVVRNARALAVALHERGFAVVGAHRGFTETHQVLVDVRRFGGGIEVTRLLERADIMVNKMLLPSARDVPDPVSEGVRIGTVEVTRLGMGPEQMTRIADLITRVVVAGEQPAQVARGVHDLRAGFRDLGYCFPAAADGTSPPLNGARGL